MSVSTSKTFSFQFGALLVAASVVFLGLLGIVAATLMQSEPSQAQQSQPAAPAGPVKTETTSFDQWVLTCQEAPPVAGAKTGKKVCWATMRVAESKSNRVVLVWRLGRDGKDVPTIALTTPTGVMVRDGVNVTLGKNVRRLDYQRCTPNECEASSPYDEAFAKELAANGEATVTFRLQDGRDVNVKVAIQGVDKVLAGLRK